MSSPFAQDEEIQFVVFHYSKAVLGSKEECVFLGDLYIPLSSVFSRKKLQGPVIPASSDSSESQSVWVLPGAERAQYFALQAHTVEEV